MSEDARPLDVREFLNRHLAEVFSTMLSLSAMPDGQVELPLTGPHVSGSVGFAGETVQGAVYLHLSAGFARSVAAAMLGLPVEEVEGQADTDDVIGEVTNMLAGGLKSAFCDAGRRCSLSPPAIIRGHSFSIRPAPNLERIWLVFACESERLAVEVHLRLN